MLIVCVGGCDSLDTAPHLFLHCNFFGEVWHFIHRWLGVCSVIPSVSTDFINQFGFVVAFLKKCYIWQKDCPEDIPTLYMCVVA